MEFEKFACNVVWSPKNAVVLFSFVFQLMSHLLLLWIMDLAFLVNRGCFSSENMRITLISFSFNEINMSLEYPSLLL